MNAKAAVSSIDNAKQDLRQNALRSGAAHAERISECVAYLLWPRPRADRIQRYLSEPSYREEMDGLSFLPAEGITPILFDGFEWPLNPFARNSDLVSAGLDILRFLKLLAHYRRFDVLISIDTASCFLFVLLKRLLRLRKPVVIIDPGLSRGYPNRDR